MKKNRDESLLATPPLSPAGENAFTGGVRDEEAGTGRVDEWGLEPIEGKAKLKAFKWLILYMIFLACFITVIFLPQDIHTAYDQHAAIEASLLEAEIDVRMEWAQITRVSDIYSFLSVVMLPTLLNRKYYNGVLLPPNEAVPSYQPYFGSYVNLVLGKIRLRQIRMSPDSCPVADVVAAISPICYSPYSLRGDITEESFAWGDQESSFSSQRDLDDGGPWESPKTKIKYAAGGFVEDLPVDDLSSALAAVSRLHDGGWIDESTRIILIDISVYNPNVDQFAFIRLAAERLASGGVVGSSRIEPGDLLTVIRSISRDNSSPRYFATFLLSLILYALVIVYSVRVADDIVDDWHSFKHYLSSGWNLMDVCMIVCFVANIALTFVWMLRSYSLSYVVDPLVEEDLWDWDKYYLLRQDMSLFRTARYFLAFGVLFCFFKALKFIGVTPSLQSLTKTVAIASNEMIAVLFVLTVIFCGYGLACVMSFGYELQQFRDFPDSIIALFRMMMGEFDMQELRQANPALGSIIFVSFMICTSFIILSMLLKIVDVAFSQVMSDIKSAVYKEDIGRQLGEACLSLTSDARWKMKKSVAYAEARSYEMVMSLIRGKSHAPSIAAGSLSTKREKEASELVAAASSEIFSENSEEAVKQTGAAMQRHKSYRALSNEELSNLNDDDITSEELSDRFALLAHRQKVMTKLSNKLSQSVLSITEQQRSKASAMSLLSAVAQRRK